MIKLIEKKLSGAIFGIKQGTKTATDATIWLKKLKQINPMLAEDYQKKLALALASRKLVQA